MCCNSTMQGRLPTSQGELIRSARGDRTQVEFARALGVDRSCLSRYESEALGAPTVVINHCLAALATSLAATGGTWPVEEALVHARLTVSTLERVAGGITPKARSPRPTKSRR